MAARNAAYIHDDIEMGEDSPDEVRKDDEVKVLAKKRAEAILRDIGSEVTYGIEDRPLLHSTILLAFQVRNA